jgi:hypothetical protein
MSVETKSEKLFQEYCSSRGYHLEPIPTGVTETPDYFVATTYARFIIEVKEISLNDDDRRVLREIEQTAGALGGDTIGRRARLLIKKAARQLKKRRSETLPMVVVLFDARPTILSLPFSSLSQENIHAAMYGDFVVRLRMRPGTGEIVGREHGLGLGRITTEIEKRYISAVSVLNQWDQSQEPFMITYHNFFADIPLPLSVFNGQKDVHLRKPARPDLCAGEWEKVSLAG